MGAVGRSRVGGVGGVEIGVLGSGVEVPDCDTNSASPRPPTFSKLPTPTPFYMFRIKSSLRQIVLASSRLRVKSLASSLFASNCHVP